MIDTSFIRKILDKITPKERKGELLNTPALYKIIKVFAINIFLICEIFVLVIPIIKIKEAYNFPETIYWVILPLLFLVIPLILILYNFIFYITPPFRKYINKVHKDNHLPNFVDSNKGVIKGLLYISPLFLVVILGLFLSYQGYSNKIVGISVILSTIFIIIIMGKCLLKSFSTKRN